MKQRKTPTAKSAKPIQGWQIEGREWWLWSLAVVVTVDSTYFGVSDKVGRIAIESVPPGQYFLHVWRESATPQGLTARSRLAFVGADHHSLPVIYVPLSSAKPTNAKNWMQ